MLESDSISLDEGSGAMLFQLFKALLMTVPQSTSYCVLRDRLASVARFRQSATKPPRKKPIAHETKSFVARVTATRKWHCECAWKSIRQESLEEMARKEKVLDRAVAEQVVEAGRRNWLGFSSRKDPTTTLTNRRQFDTRDPSLQQQQQQRTGPTRSLQAESSLSAASRQRYESLTEASSSSSSSSLTAAANGKDQDEKAVKKEGRRKNRPEETNLATSLSVDTAADDESVADSNMREEDQHPTNDDDDDVMPRASETAVVQEWKQFWVDSTTTTTTSSASVDRHE
jgi:hypothetical protein